MSAPNVFDEIGNAIGGVFNSLGQAMDSGAKGLTRGLQSEPQVAPRPVVAKRKPATIASMKPVQANEVGRESPKGNEHKVGEWYMKDGMLTMRLPSLNPFKKDGKPAVASNPKPKHLASAGIKGKNRDRQFASKKPSSASPQI